VAELKDNLNTMIDNLRLTTEQNTDQDWLKTNLARFTSMLQGQRELAVVGRMLLSELASLVGAQNGVIYLVDSDGGPEMVPGLKLLAAYADSGIGGHPDRLSFGEGLIGQCAVDGRRILIVNAPGNLVPIRSGLFTASPRSIIVLPVLFEGKVKAVIELASVDSFTHLQQVFLDQLTGGIGIMLNGIAATMQTEGLLKQSQQLAAELQAQQRELRQTNEQLEQKAGQLAEQKVEVERQNQEIEQARGALEEKATELALISRYKSEFLANMSHELRTPLNSILILGQQLVDNSDGNLTPRQVEFARTIHGAGTDLLNLISDILDLSKIESGTVSVEAEEILLANLLEQVTRPFRHEAEDRGLFFEVRMDPQLRSITTDSKRLQQVLKNLLSNAVKFTEHGEVRLWISGASSGWSAEHPVLIHSQRVIAFEVTDTGIGIPPEKQRIIFEAFQQADASTGRRHGGTGLGLAISRELASLLGGEIQLRSTPGVGSSFTLYLPAEYTDTRRASLSGSHDLKARAERLLDETAVFLNRVVADLPAEKQRVLERLHGSDDLLVGRKILLVDDDTRNIFAFSSALKRRGMLVLTATTGREAISLLEATPDLALVLMDIMMPDMDGYQTIQVIRSKEQFRRLPIIALTAKAMMGDREKCLEAGASDYLAKPVNTEQLLAALRIWLPR
jgi:signal transduction histidine kinase